MTAPTIEAAHTMGEKGAQASGVPHDDAERLAFEAWIAGHCWTLGGAVWNGTSYVSETETTGWADPRAVRTRQLWAAWRDRAALAAAAQPAHAPSVPGALKPGDAAWMRVRIDTEVRDDACFATPARHPQDIAKGHDEWNEGAQVFGCVYATPQPAPAAVPAGCGYPACYGPGPEHGECCRRPFTNAMAEAGERYWRTVGQHAHPLPAQFRWCDCFLAMAAAAPAPATGGEHE